MTGTDPRTPTVPHASTLRRLPVLLLLALATAGCRGDQAATEHRRAVEEWLACFECTDGERDRVVRDVGHDAVPYLRDALLDLPDVYLDNARRSLEIRWSRLPNPPVSQAEYVAHYTANLEATLQRRAARALGDLGQVDILEEALSPPHLIGYRADVVRVIEQSRDVALAVRAGRAVAPVAAVDSIALWPPAFTLEVGSSGLVEAIVRDSTGALLDVPLSWSSTDDAVASVAPRTGRPAALVSAHTPGSADVRVTADGRTATASVTVVPAPPPGPLVERTGGDEQVARVRTEFTDLLEVRVRDPGTGRPQVGVRVEWRVTVGGAAIESGTGSTAVAVTTQTGAGGRTAVRVHAGSTPGPVRVTATAAGGETVEFRLRVVPAR